MSDAGFGANAELEVDITIDAAQAARELEERFAKAIVGALNSAQVKAAIAQMVSGMTVAVNKLQATFDQMFRRATSQGRGFARDLTKEFEKVGKAAREAFNMQQSRGARPELQAVSAQVVAITENMQKLATGTRQALAVVEELGRASRASLNATNTELRAQTALSTQGDRLRIVQIQAATAAARTAGQIQAAQIRAHAQQVTQAMRSITKIIEITWDVAKTAVTGFVRIAGTTLRGFGRTVEAIFRGIGATIRGFGRGLNSIFSGFGKGAISALRGISSAFQAAFRRDENAYRTSLRSRERALSTSLANQSRQIQSFQNRTSRGLAGALTGRGVGGGLALAGGGFGIASILTGGFERFGDIERLTFQFERLLGSGEKAQALLEDISDFARATPFDLRGVAGLAANFLAMGQSVEEVLPNIEKLSDVVSFAGGNTESLERIQRALGQVISTGKLQGDELNQLAENLPGINIRQIIADQMGISTADLRKMQEDGNLSADAFITAFLAGIDDPRFAGASEEMAKTVTGRLANLKESFSIFGASLVGLVAGPLTAAFEKITDILNTVGSFISGEMFEREGLLVTGGFEIFPELDENLQRLELFRDILLNIAKALGVLLAVKGAVEVFGLLGNAVAFLLTPLGAIAAAVVLVTGAFTLFNRFSDKFAYTFNVLGNQVGPLIDSFKRLGDIVFGIFRRGGEGGGAAGIITKIGDAFRYVNIWAARVLRELRYIIDGIGTLIALGRADFIDDFIISKLRTVDETIAETLGSIFNIDQADIDAEGGGIAGFLRNTFLEPIVNFFTSTLPNALKFLGGVVLGAITGFAGFIGDIWGAIFGGDEGGGGRPGGGGGIGLAAIEARILGDEGDQRNVGQRILDVLENTFLGPVVRFFRGPFADIIEGIGSFITTYIGPTIGAGLGYAVRGIVTAFQFLADGLSSAWSVLQPILAPIGEAFANFGETFKTEGLGTALGDVFASIGDAGINIWEGADGTGGLKAGLESVIDNITGWFSDNFTAANFAKVAGLALNALREVGEQIGRFLSSPEFITVSLAVVGSVTAAILAIVGSIALGLAQGVYSNFDEWGNIILRGLQLAWDKVREEGPGALGDAIKAVIADPQILIGIAAAGIVLGTQTGRSLVTSVFGLIANRFRSKDQSAVISRAITDALRKADIGGAVSSGINSSLNSGGGGNPSQAARNDRGPVGRFFTNLANRLKPSPEFLNKVKSAGLAIGGALLGGIAAFEAGNLGGRAGSTGGLLLGLLSGVGVGAATGAAVGGVPGAVAGGILGGLLATIGSAIGATGREAEEAAARIDTYAAALRGLEGSASETAGAAAVLEQLAVVLSPEALQTLADAGFNASEFFDDMAAGGSQRAGAFADVVDGIAGSLERLGGSVNEIDAFNLRFLGDLITAGPENGGFATLPQSLDEVNHQLDLLRENGTLTETQVDALKDTFDRLAEAGIPLDEIFRDLFSEGTALETAINAEAVIQDLEDIAGAADGTNEKLRALDKVTTDQLAGALEAIGEILDGMPSRAEAAQQALQDALEVDRYGGSFEAFQDQFQIDIPNLDDQLNAALEGTSGAARTSTLNKFAGDYADDLMAGITAGINDGSIANSEELDSALAGIFAGIDTSDLTADQKEALRVAFEEILPDDLDDLLDNAAAAAQAELEAAFAKKSADIPQLVSAGSLGKGIAEQTAAGITSNAALVDDAVDTMLDTALGDSGSAKSRGGSNPNAEAAGKGVSTGISTGIRSGAPAVIGSARAISIGVTLTFFQLASSMFNIGQNAGGALARGLQSQIGAAAAAAAAIANAAANAAAAALKIKSPSQVFIDIGKQVGAGFIQGIKDAEGDMTDAISDGLEHAITVGVERARKAVQDAEVGQGIFDLLQPSLLPGGTTNTEVRLARLDQTLGKFDFAASLRDAIGSAFSATAAGSGVANARRAAQQIPTDFIQNFYAQQDAFKAAKAARDALAKYDRERAALEAKRARIGKAQYDKELKELGDRPAQLTFEQRNILASGALTLNPANVAGQANIGAFTGALETIRTLGDEMIAQGTPLATVISTMQSYRDQLLRQATAYGFNATNLNTLVSQYGLSDAALKSLAATMTSLNASTLTGATNVQQFVQQSQGIRDFLSELIGAGVPVSKAVAEAKALRNQLINQAVAFGFNRKTLEGLINEIGLSDTALANFVKQLEAFNKEAANANTVAAQAAAAAGGGSTASPGGIPAPVIITNNISVPYGDPEAIAYSVSNRQAYDRLVSW